MKLFGYVAGKLVALIVGSMIVLFGLATWYNLRVQERATTKILTLNGVQLADLVTGATRQAMMHNDREALQGTVETLGHQRDIVRMRILAKTGKVAYSADRGEVNTAVSTGSGQCQLCHSKTPPPESLTTSQMVRRVVREGRPALEITQIVRNAPDCTNAPCHVHPADQRLLGFMDISLDLAPYEIARRTSAWQLLFASVLGIVTVSVITFVSLRRMVQRPVRQMIKSAEALALGDHSVRVPELTRDELGRLARTFNRMSRDLEKAHSELLDWAQTLEQRVQQKTQELEQARDQIIRVDRLASLGRLAAVVAHEINNPLSSVVTYAKIMIRRQEGRPATEDVQDSLQYLNSIASEAARCGEIVSQLLSFARQRGGEFTKVNVNPVVEKSIFLVHHKLDMASVKPVLDLQADLPDIYADGSQVQQALMALLINSCEAMEKGGQVTIRTRQTEDGVRVVVEDNGPGMPPEVAAHAFEPFFTTKTAGSGVGLGLAVVYGIVQRHGGDIDLKTAPGVGCRFSITLPLIPPGADLEVRQ